YALLFMPLWGLWALLLSLDAWPGERTNARARQWGARIAAAAAGFALGAIPYLLLLVNPRHTEGTLTLTMGDVSRRFALLVDECLPALLSTRVYSYAPDGTWGPYPFSALFQALQRVGAWLLLGAIGSGFVLAFVRRIPWSVRRIGLVGAAALPLNLAAFL